MTKQNFADVKGKDNILYTSGWVFLTAQILMVVLLLFGIVSYYGANLSMFGAIELVIDITKIKRGAILEGLLKVAIGGTYIYVVVRIIKNTLESRSYLRKLFERNIEEEGQSKEKNFFVLLGYVGDSLKWCALFMMLCIMSSVDFTINWKGIILIIAMSIFYLASCTAMMYLKNVKKEDIIYKSVAVGVAFLAFILLLTKIRIASIEELIYGLRYFFGGYLKPLTFKGLILAVGMLASPILCIIMQYYAVTYIYDVWGIDFFLNSKTAAYTTRKIVTMAISIVVANAIIRIVSGGAEISDIGSLFKAVRQDLPMLLTSIALFLCYKFENIDKEPVTGVATGVYTWKCEKCGAVNPSTSLFCSGCKGLRNKK